MEYMEDGGMVDGLNVAARLGKSAFFSFCLLFLLRNAKNGFAPAFYAILSAKESKLPFFEQAVVLKAFLAFSLSCRTKLVFKIF